MERALRARSIIINIGRARSARPTKASRWTVAPEGESSQAADGRIGWPPTNPIMHRRQFLTTAAALATPHLLPRSLRGAPPSGRIGVGLIGIGCMGRGHLHLLANHPEVQLLAVCDVDRERREPVGRLDQRTGAGKYPTGIQRASGSTALGSP